VRETAGGTQKPLVSRKATPKYEEYQPDDTPTPPPVRPDLPKTINVKQTTHIRSIVPGTVWRQRPFKWEPQAFVPESERLKDTIKDEAIQNRSLKLFMDDPTLPLIYCVSGTPDDSKAEYFAAHLVALHLEKLKAKASVVWCPLYGGFDNPMFKDYGYYSDNDPTMIVLSNLSPTATNVKLDKCRDILKRFGEIPRVVVVAGEDPFSFMATRLYSPLNAMAFFSESLLKKRVEVY
jgi:hypothetical protein